MFFLDILTRYILPVIYDSFVVLVLVLFFLFIFRIKDSNIRILFFFLPLIKPFIIILERVNVNKLYSMTHGQASGIRLPDPASIIKFEITPVELISNPNYLIISIAISLIIIILIIRWIGLALFYRKLAFEDRVSRREIPEVFKTVDNYVERAKIRVPYVSLTHRSYISPFVIGIKKTVLVLSPMLLDKLNPEEKEILLKHELSHIKRNDNLIGWLALILRDLNFFNPFAYIAYYLIRSEQEVASDKLIIKYSDYSPREIANNILTSILKLIKLADIKNRFIPSVGSPFSLV
ncbi:MAG TPA: hypothetical protein DCP02_06330, partial [Actinobacteria bacterium]|nr:hypothetical protein [Actinomycetota bacterium]